MTITLDSMLTTLQMEFKFAKTTKQTDATKAIQFAVNQIVDDFIDSRDLKTDTGWLSCTQYQPYVDLAGALDTMYANRIRRVLLRNTSQNDDNSTLEEIDYEQDYTVFLQDETDPDSEHYGEPYAFARYKDYIYLKYVPDETTFEVKVLFEKTHPIISDSQDIILPADFEECIFHGAMYLLYSFVERKDGQLERHKVLFDQQRKMKIEKYTDSPGTIDIMATNWFPTTKFGYQVELHNGIGR